MKLDFESGKVRDVACRQRLHRRREYRWLSTVLLLTSLPYAGLFYWHPAIAAYAIVSLALFKVVAAFFTSTQTHLAHHIRFLLAGRNPFGMTGAASVLLGGLDAIVDWREDRPARLRQPLFYGAITLTRLMTTPLGVVLLAMEFLWDVVLLRRGLRLVRLKWSEFFALAYYHDLICPEKSNDIFYADLAWARYRNDPYLYQWNRMRALVFELQHYRLDIEAGAGVPSSNLFRQSELEAYQTLKRLQVETIETAIAAYYAEHLDGFPLPGKLAASLVAGARPLAHYLRFRRQLWSESRPECGTGGQAAYDRELTTLFYQRRPPQMTEETADHRRRGPYFTWHVLRLLDANPEPISCEVSKHITAEVLSAMQKLGIPVERSGTRKALASEVRDSSAEPRGGQESAVPDEEREAAAWYGWDPQFLLDLDALVDRHFRRVDDAAELRRLEQLPLAALLRNRGTVYVPREPS